MNSACELGRHSARALKPYPDYTDSGVEWLGNVPAHWHARRLKNVAGLIMGQSPSSEDCSTARIGLPFIQGCAEFGSDHPEPVQFCLAPAKVSPAGAILLSVRAPVGRLNVADQRYGIGRGLCAVVPRPSFLDATFCRYSLGSSTVGLTLQSTGSTYDAVSVGDVACLRTVVPSISEQAAIVRFLDHADRRIRCYIRAKQQLIALLEEQKQAIIHQAVTGQIDVRTGKPYQAYKPSGVEWFPEVPDHWSVLPMRRVIYSAVDGPHFSPTYLDTGIPFLSARNVKSDAWSLKDAKYISEEDYDEFNRRVKPVRGDVLYTKGGTTGVARVVDLTFPFQVWVHIAVLKVNKNAIDPGFLAAALNSTRCYEQSQLFTRGATNQDLGLGRMKGIELPVPPALAEQ